MLSRGRAIAEPAIWVASLSAAFLLLLPRGFPNYDTVYYLLWGREIAHGMSPDYGAPLAPTPHPLYDFLGAALTPLGDGAITVTMVIAYASLALVAWLVYRLGREWLNRPVGLAAAAVVITSAPFLSNGLRAYIDIPYIALCLAALLIETRRPRAGWPVLALLALAGLLRPEAWLFSGIYVLYLAWSAARPEPRKAESLSLREELRALRAPIGGVVGELIRRPGVIAPAVSAPVIWIAFDWITTGNPLYSLTGTRETVETLDRASGPVDVVLYGPRRLGEVLQWPGMVGALVGIVLTLATLRSRVRLALGAAVLALVAFAILGAAGLAIIPRYTMPAASILAVFIGAALFGWLLLERGDRIRRLWQAVAVLLAVFYIAWIPNQLDLLGNVDRDLGNQGLVERDLERLVESGAFEPLGTDAAEEVEHCLPISAPNHRAVPRLAFWLDIRPSQIVSEDVRPGGTRGGDSAGVDQMAPERDQRPGWFLAPAREFTIQNFILDPGDPIRETGEPPPDFELVAENRSWLLYRNC